MRGGEINLAKIGPGHRLVNVEAKYSGSETQREKNSSLILACCRGKAEANRAVFVTLLILGHQE